MKGQSSVEYSLVIGLALLLASPFLVSSQSSIIQLEESTSYLQLENSLESLEQRSNTLSEKSFPARRTMRFDTPTGIDRIYNPQFGSGGSAVIFQISRAGRTNNRSFLVDYSIRIQNQSQIAEEGIHRISIKKLPNGINVSTIS